MDFSLRVNCKKNSNGDKKPTAEENKDRDKQFIYIKELREQFCENDDIIISVDTKNKEMIGNFKNEGKVWSNKEIPVNDHDFPSYSKGKAIPYCIYNIRKNSGTVFVGTTHDTPRFTVDCIQKWLEKEGRNLHPISQKMLVLADCGGSNSSRSRVWKYDIQEKVSNKYGLTVTVCHFPPGTSKWNPVEHRLNSQISRNWEGKPLKCIETVLKYIRSTKTITGLKVKAHFVRKHYKLGEKVSDQEMDEISIVGHDVFPKWNYTISPSIKPKM